MKICNLSLAAIILSLIVNVHGQFLMASETSIDEELLSAVATNDLIEARRLLESGANPNQLPYVPDTYWLCGSYPSLLGVAAMGQKDSPNVNFSEMISLLVSFGAKVDGDDKEGVCSPLFFAALHGDNINHVSQLLSLGADPNAVEPRDNAFFRMSALNNAIALGRPRIVQELVKRGAGQNNQALNIGESIHWAFYRYGFNEAGYDCHKDTLAILQILLENSANPNSLDMRGISPLAKAAQVCGASEVDFLLKSGASLEQESRAPRGANQKDKWNPLMFALYSNNENVANLLIKNGANAAYVSPVEHSTPIIFSACANNTWISKQIIAFGNVNIEGRSTLDLKPFPNNTPISGKTTPAICAAYNGNIDLLSDLLNAGADPSHIVNDGGWHKVINAAEAVSMGLMSDDSALKIATLLSEKGADFKRCIQQYSPLTWALHSGKGKKFINFLIENGATVDSYGECYGKAIHKMFNGRVDLDVVRLVLATKPNVNFINDSDVDLRTSPLAKAVVDGNTSVIQTLLTMGANVNQVNIETGQTPLFQAVKSGSLAAARLLCQGGASVNHVDKWGRKAREYGFDSLSGERFIDIDYYLDSQCRTK